MDEEKQITYMQIRLIRMTAEKMQISLYDATLLFEKYNILSFIRQGFGIFHVEGDKAVFEEVQKHLLMKGGTI
ncbi:MAG: DUF3791 domain-containing protein [Treponema sp.]|nr:DUF3791 domain-containing protein [Treponema sp.]